MSEETIWSLEIALASLGGAKRARSEMVVDVGSDMWERLSWGSMQKVLTLWGVVVGREGLGEAMAEISIASGFFLSLAALVSGGWSWVKNDEMMKWW